MLPVIKRTALGALLLILLPAIVALSGWVWQPGTDTPWLKIMYGLTETVTQPWGVITHIVLFGWFLWCLRFRLKAALVLFAILAVAIVVGQSAKSMIKVRVQEPRPFVVWLEKSHNIPVEQFYNLKRKARGELVEQQLHNERDIPLWLRGHWQKETGFAFPSGHTVFAATWALLGVGLLWPRRRIVTIAVLLVWAMGVMGSRMLLGMHWPRDLIVATLMSWLLVAVACWLTQRWCGPLSPPRQEQSEIAQRTESDE